jgi:hypothetical protein
MISIMQLLNFLNIRNSQKHTFDNMNDVKETRFNTFFNVANGSNSNCKFLEGICTKRCMSRKFSSFPFYSFYTKKFQKSVLSKQLHSINKKKLNNRNKNYR